MANYRLGENGVLYYKAAIITAVTASSDLTTAQANVREVKVSTGLDTPEFTTRANNGIKQFAASLTEYTLGFKLLCPGDVADAAYGVFRDAWINKAPLFAAELSAAKTVAGAEGPAGNWIVAKFDRDDSNGQVLMIDVELKTNSMNSWFIATGS